MDWGRAHMDLHQLKVFHTAVQAGSFTNASRKLNLSQSTVSQHIKQLEDDLGCPLFMRVGKQVIPTPAGRLLYEHCERIFQDVMNAEMSIQELSGQRKGRVRFGSGATTLIYQLPHVLELYRALYPDVELIVVSDISEVLRQEVLAHRLDLALVMLPVEEPNLQVEPLCMEELKVAVPARHPLAKKRELRASDLAQLRFILYERRTVMRQLIDNFLSDLGVQPQVSMVMENIEAIKSLIGSGLGASVLPVHAIGNEAADRKVRLMRVKGKRLHRQLALITLKSNYLPFAVRELGRLIAEELNRRGAQRG